MNLTNVLAWDVREPVNNVDVKASTSTAKINYLYKGVSLVAQIVRKSFDQSYKALSTCFASQPSESVRKLDEKEVFHFSEASFTIRVNTHEQVKKAHCHEHHSKGVYAYHINI